MAAGDLRLRLYEAFLTYPAGQEVHTASSGRITALHELFLAIEDRAADVRAIGEIRANIGFITGTPDDAVLPAVRALLARLADARSFDELSSRFAEIRRVFPKIAQALIDNTLVDLAAKRAGVPACESLGGAYRPALACNQCVFWGSDADMRANMAIYRSHGFSKIKVRVGIGALEDDLRRLAWLRDEFGGDIALAIDANGAWSADEALSAVAQLAQFGLDYVEQPTHPGDWDALERVASSCDLLVMIDEGLQTEDDVARVCANGGLIAAHLKIAKAGGVTDMMKIGRRFDSHGVSYVTGQMNEGAASTAIAVHAAMALAPLVSELYGALGIVNDPCEGVGYDNGLVSVRHASGLGVSIRHDRWTLLWDSEA